MKRETNTKALQKLDFNTFMKEPSGSKFCAFNALVLRIGQLSSIATTAQQMDKAKITNLMNTIEHNNWYLTATAGVENMPHFMVVVQKVNQELGKITTSIPNFDEPADRQDTDRYKFKRNILLVQGLQDDDSASNSDDSDDNYHAHSSGSEGKNPVAINFGGQRRYWRPPGNHRHYHNHYGRHQRRRYDRDRGSGR